MIPSALPSAIFSFPQVEIAGDIGIMSKRIELIAKYKILSSKYRKI